MQLVEKIVRRQAVGVYQEHGLCGMIVVVSSLLHLFINRHKHTRQFPWTRDHKIQVALTIPRFDAKKSTRAPREPVPGQAGVVGVNRGGFAQFHVMYGLAVVSQRRSPHYFSHKKRCRRLLLAGIHRCVIDIVQRLGEVVRVRKSSLSDQRRGSGKVIDHRDQKASITYSYTAGEMWDNSKEKRQIFQSHHTDLKERQVSQVVDRIQRTAVVVPGRVRLRTLENGHVQRQLLVLIVLRRSSITAAAAVRCPHCLIDGVAQPLNFEQGLHACMHACMREVMPCWPGVA